MTASQNRTNLPRRRLLQMGAGAVLISVLPRNASATPADLETIQKELFGDRPIQEGRVALVVPPISENGNAVPITVRVDSPMTPEDHVRHIYVFSPRNPLPNIAHFHLGPHNGKAEISTRIRLAGTQNLQAVAEMSDGSLWSATAETIVTLAACVIL